MAVKALNKACEDTIVNYMLANLDQTEVSASFYTGINNVEELEAPAVVVSARIGHEVYWNTNIYAISVTVSCKEMAWDTSSGSLGNLAANVFNCFYDPARNVNFTNTGSGFVTFQVQPKDIETEVTEDVLVNKLTCDFIGCLSGTNFS